MLDAARRTQEGPEEHMAKLPLRLPTLRLADLEAIAIRMALDRNFWMIGESAAELGISRWKLMRKMRAMGLKSPRAPSKRPTNDAPEEV